MRACLSWPFYRLRLINVKAPDRLLIAPQDIRTADPTIAAEIYAGYFAFAGKVVNTHGQLPFEIAAQDPEWERMLNSFGWLRHLRAAGSALASANGRVLVDDFLIHADKVKQGPAWETRVVTRRLLAFLAQSPMILEGADHDFYRRYMRGLARAAIFLDHGLKTGLIGEPRLFAAIALAEYGLCAHHPTAYQRKTSKLLAEELARQILPDGGHISRNPDVLIRLLLDLLPLRQAYAVQAVQPPPQLLNAIDRMLPMLRLLQHGDGTLALFNGMGVTAPDLLATVLAYDDVRAQPLINAPYSGYQRIEAEASVVIIDTGRMPPADVSTLAHAGCLSFEFSIGTERLVVNCGTPDPLRAMPRGPARVTAAHSTLVIADTSSCRFAGRHGLEGFFAEQILAGPMRVAIERQNTAKRTRMRFAHDGYVSRFGLVHERRLALSADGLRLDGEDRVRPAAGVKLRAVEPYALRFHIHPAVRLHSLQDAGAVLCILPDGERWIFASPDAAITIEESIFFAAADGPRRCEQIVIYSDSQKPRLAWSFHRLDEAMLEAIEAESQTEELAPGIHQE
jgi:uncharacterized heparinase superfamily protein